MTSKRPAYTAWAPALTLIAVSYVASADSWTCEKAGLTREVLVSYPQAPARLPCRVYYTKPLENAMPRVLWRAQNSDRYCQQKAADFVAQLESWGWRCMVGDAKPDR